MGAALLVSDEDVTDLGVLAEDVVERQDDAAGIAEEDVDPLPDEGLADDVRADPRPASRSRVVEHRPTRPLDIGGVGGSVSRHVGPGRAGTRRPPGVPSRQCHRSLPIQVVSRTNKNPRHPARVPSVFGSGGA